jgi:hypothetical protein
VKAKAKAKAKAMLTTAGKVEVKTGKEMMKRRLGI